MSELVPHVLGNGLRILGGNLVLATPSSGTALTVNGVVLGNFLTLTDGTRTASIGCNGASDMQFGTNSNHNLDIFANSVTRLVIGNNGNLTITVPGSGTTLTANSLNAARLTQFISTGALGALSTGFNIGLAGSAWNIFGEGADPIAIGTQGASILSLWTSGTQRTSISSGGNVTIASPTSGTTLALTTTSALANALSWTDGTRVGVLQAAVGGVFSGSTSSDPYFLMTAGGSRVQITAAGNVIVNTPTSGVPLTVSASAASNVGINVTAASNTTLQINVSNTGGGVATSANLDLNDGSSTATVSYQASTMTLANSVTNGVAGNALQVGPINAVPLLLCTNLTARVNIDGNGKITQFAPTSAVATSIQLATNGTGLGNDIDITGSFNGSNELAYRSTNAGTSARSSLSAADSGSLGVGIFAAGANFTGSLIGNGPTGRGGAMHLNYAGPLTFGTNASAAFQITSTQTLSGFGPVAAAFVDMTPDKGSWTTTLSGLYSSNPTGTLKWERMGNIVTIWCDANITATSNTTAFTISASALPAAITPSSNRIVACLGISDNIGSTQGAAGFTQVNSAGTLTIGLIATAGGVNPVGIGSQNIQFSNSTGVGLLAGWSITYSL